MNRSPFCKLASPADYVACELDLVKQSEERAYLIDMFKRHFPTLLKHGVDVGVARGERREVAQTRAVNCQSDLNRQFDAFGQSPDQFGRVTALTLDEWRDQTLRRYGFEDPFVDLKEKENDLAIRMLPRVCEEIDAIIDEREQLRGVIEGVFAGNIFDMGAEETARQIMEGKLDFFRTRESLPRRPWLIDQYDALERAFLTKRYRKLVLFVDNAGADFVLGTLPLSRWFARQGTQVVLVGNELPTLNDMTVHDIRNLWPRVIATEQSFAELPIIVVSSGTGEPLIDLSLVSDELNQASSDADLVIIQGMGRGVESNLNAAFACDAANLAMIKDPFVARFNGGTIYDVVCRFR